MGGRAGTRLTYVAASVSRMTLLRMLRGLPDPHRPTPRVLGVDDFTMRRGYDYDARYWSRRGDRLPGPRQHFAARLDIADR